jgi:NAD+ kinase
MTSTFKNICIYGRERAHDESIVPTLQKIGEFIQSQGITLHVEQETAKLIPNCDSPTMALSQLQHQDLLVVVGGDGSLLQAARSVVKANIPVLGVNRGRLGFLTDVLPEDIEQSLSAVLAGDFHIEERFLLDTAVFRNEELSSHGDALNDIVLLPGDVAHMIEFTIYVDDKLVCHQRADGLIVATPTGSTAYALSGGGPILHPSLEAIALVPMFPHTLSSRPLVVSSDSHITIKMDPNTVIQPRLSCDGQMNYPLVANDVIKISKKPDLLKLLHPKDYDYYQTLRSKLGWQSKPSQR